MNGLDNTRYTEFKVEIGEQLLLPLTHLSRNGIIREAPKLNKRKVQLRLNKKKRIRI
jgi:hypothetical protein